MAALQTAQLVTPRGEKILLSPQVYESVLSFLKRQTIPRQTAQTELQAVIRETYGKYAGRTSLTPVLLAERQLDWEREEAKLVSLFSGYERCLEGRQAM